MSAGSVVVLGAANVDLVLRVDAIPVPGETVSALGSEVHAGGKGLNQAVAAARSGARTRLLAAIGDDEYGRFLRAEAEEAGVDAGGVRVVAERTGSAYVVVDSRGENSIVIDGGANSTFRGVSELERQTIAGADVVALQRECPVGSAFDAAKAAQAAGRTVILNAAPAQGLPPELLALVDVLIVNEGEAATILRELGRLDAGRSVDDQVRALAERVPAVVVTRGASGLVLGRGEEVLAVSAHHAEVVDTTGAGDTFCGALASEVARGSTLEEACRYASAAAALSVGRRGAVSSIPTRSQVEELLAVP